MSSGVSKTRAGSVIGTGAPLTISGLEFRPRVVKIINTDDLDGLDWSQHMADASAVKTVAAGTRTFITTLGVTPLSDGFIIGADTAVNVAGEQIHWVAHE